MKTILWDFDGVILDSMKIRDLGFEIIFESYEAKDVKKLLEFHRINGGLSRYVKIRYFFEEILKKEVSENTIIKFASKFSEYMRAELTQKKYLIEETVNFIGQNYNKYNFHIVSGSDQNELRFLCEKLEINTFFLSIHGSPTPKIQLVKDLLTIYKYDKKEVFLIGDSINDYEAATINSIDFIGYNNEDLEKLNTIPTIF
ncbi:HAD family hydrolase [Cellulophaga sp. L1A9]|uniref:HAD family hydrolase n=1 Tax=Cellulophaga sp. L1A9 TaxID=2686362 RepID=UPI00131D522B|nr:HAD hydrolase-like protein [Cellulophaga sp. L1A9]